MLDLVQCIKDILYRLGLIQDYVIAQGKSGEWNYRKWNSGAAECWTTRHEVIAPYSTSGAGLPYARAILFTYPFDFVDNPTVTAMANTGSGFAFTFHSPTLSEKNKRTYVYWASNSPSNNTLYSNVNVHAIGRWK